MQWLIDLVTNRILIVVIITMVFTQIFKGLLYSVVNRKFEISRFFGDGGMPSCHAAVVSSLSTACGIRNGFGSPAFAICVVLTMIVCRDATGVRMETGKQATAIMEMQSIIKLISSKEMADVKLREFVGHTPMQVLIGLLFGIVCAVILCQFI